MLSKKKILAFTLAEIMVVMLVLTIIFAAFAPLITKRKTKPNNVDIWQWSSRDYFRGPMDAYYPSSSGNRGTLFFGLSPDVQDDIDKLYTPYAKVIIRSGPVTAKNIIQRQMQFRFRRANLTDAGDFAGTLLMDTKNVLLGGFYDFLYFTNSSAAPIPNVDNQNYPNRNVAIGYMALNYPEVADSVDKTAKNNTAVGFRALYSSSLARDNVAIGAHAGETNRTGSNNVYIGSMAGYSSTGSNNVYVGYSSGAGSGDYNTFIGAYTGNIYGSADDSDSDTSGYDNSNTSWGANNSASHNVAIGFRALNNIKNGKYNTAIGSYALENVTDGMYNTAIGYGACKNVTSGSFKTCIGYNSGPVSTSDVESSNRGYDTVSVLSIKPDDGVKKDPDKSNTEEPAIQRTYIGGKPHYNGANSLSFGGDAVLEIHNSAYDNKNMINDPEIKSNTTTVVNGNLFVRGQTFFTIGSKLYPFYFKEISNVNYFGTDLSISGNDAACLKNQFYYKYLNTASGCSTLSDVFTLSDRRLKNIGAPNNDGLDKILKINVYNYTFKADKNNSPQVGVIAQELKNIFPSAVSIDNQGFLKIRKEDIFYAAVNAIKELQHKIAILYDKVFSFEGKIKQLEAENEELSKEIDNLAAKINSLKQK